VIAAWSERYRDRRNCGCWYSWRTGVSDQEGCRARCYLLILREFMHQLGFDRIAVVADTPEH
jgi:hypothetical protein